MRIAIFGATGRTGRHLVEQALAAGHHVTALARDPGGLGPARERLAVVQGDALDAGAVERAVAGADVVLDALGHVKGSPAGLREDFARNLVAAMNRHGIRRLVSLTGAGVGDPNDRPRPVDRAFGILLRLLSRKVIVDSLRHDRLVRDSGLDWTIVRAPVLTDGRPVGRVRVGYLGGDVGIRLDRADLARFMLEQAADRTYLHRAPVVTG